MNVFPMVIKTLISRNQTPSLVGGDDDGDRLGVDIGIIYAYLYFSILICPSLLTESVGIPLLFFPTRINENPSHKPISWLSSA